ncbi:MAG: UDP-N-acetylglucosamine 1-carboxyvinyltransferase [Acidobacteria bacterium]|nr:UDP-N-acetylglucosamine 1-carboxyvinyltransferase [Acidobacteriota bacterium]MBV9476940.1 UDP-N-acetylglucosamine 1-carboxyvinyltransferase [Acidobacteriota bacterium]
MALERFVVEGGRRLEGTIRPGGNKNAALPILAACLLTDEPVVLRNLPDIQDVRVMLQILEQLGASVERVEANVVRITSRGDIGCNPDPELSKKIRASILLAGPLLARCGQVAVAKPGGDAIGRRRVDTHLLALEGLGAQIEVSAHEYRMEARALKGRKMFLDEASVTATENAIMAAVLAEGETQIYNAAAEPHVQDLCHFLNALGANIDGIATNSLRINGVESLHGGEFHINSDHIEVGSYIGLAAVTRSELLIEDAVPEHMYAVRYMLEKLGVDIRVEGKNIRVPREQELRVRYDIGAAVPKIDDGPWPLFPADLLSIMIVIATQAEGTVMIFEKMFESRLFFTDKLISMGARIILCDPHRAIIVGGGRLHGGEISSPDIRAGMALLLAALCAKGESIIHNVHQIDRGYERIDDRLNALGARITRERDV